MAPEVCLGSATLFRQQRSKRAMTAESRVRMSFLDPSPLQSVCTHACRIPSCLATYTVITHCSVWPGHRPTCSAWDGGSSDDAANNIQWLTPTPRAPWCGSRMPRRAGSRAWCSKSAAMAWMSRSSQAPCPLASPRTHLCKIPAHGWVSRCEEAQPESFLACLAEDRSCWGFAGLGLLSWAGAQS